MASPLPIQIPSSVQPVVDPQTGLMTRPWFTFFAQLSANYIQGPAFGSVVNGDAVKFDGTSGRLVKK